MDRLSEFNRKMKENDLKLEVFTLQSDNLKLKARIKDLERLVEMNKISDYKSSHKLFLNDLKKTLGLSETDALGYNPLTGEIIKE